MSHVSLVNLKRQAKRYGITQDEGEARPAVARQESTARAVLRHATGWAGDDLESRLAEVYASRARV